MAANITPIKDGWKFSQTGGSGGDGKVVVGEWMDVQSFPTTVHVELLKSGKIPDPFVGLNEWEVQWVGEAEWAFKTEFSVSAQELSRPNADLVFEGLDTFATVLLNGKEILKTTNQFVLHRVPVKDLLVSGPNELLINFASAFREGRKVESEHDKLKLWNGDSSRLHVRKAQYNYGWDWGPILMTTGPWKPIYLETYQTRISEWDIRAKVSEQLDTILSVSFRLSDGSSQNVVASVDVKGPDGHSIAGHSNVQLLGSDAQAQFSFSKGSVELWYPVGYGAQPLYTVEIQVVDDHGVVLDTKDQQIGFRRAVILQHELIDQDGRSFVFEVNNIRIFCGGSNWIPADSFLTTMTAERYRAWLQLLVDGNQNMIRIWGGGIYEYDSFYDICDELGILVWQDFMFGCGQYPAYDSFVESVQIEAEQNVRRLRHHPSIVIFAGNNEDYALAESSGLEINYEDEDSDFRKTTFPARYIYERVLPAVVEKLSDIHYHRSSPYSGFGKVSSDLQHGDLHQWNVWHGSQEPWHNWDKLAGRFVSEFGMEGYPDIRTVDYWLGGDKSERYPQSRTMNNHNKADGFERRLELYLVENFKHAFDIESYVYYTQIMQAETLASAYRLWRRNWKGKNKEYTAGALVWQLNDCWPVTSWAICDYFLRPKPAYYTIKRELGLFTVGMTRKDVTTYPDPHSAAEFTITTALEIWGTNSTLTQKKAVLEVSSFDLLASEGEGEGEKKDGLVDKWTKEVVLEANQTTELWKGEVPGQPKRTKLSEVVKTIVVSARLLDLVSGEVLGRYANWPEPFKFITFPPPSTLGLSVTISSDGDSVELTTHKPIKGLVLDVKDIKLEDDEVKWSDQGIDLVPGDKQVVKVKGLEGREVKVRFLGDGSAGEFSQHGGENV